MKKLLFVMMAILAFNVTNAAELGEEQGIPEGQCYKTMADSQRGAKEDINDSQSQQEETQESSVING